jgi:hypothetical protein
MKWFKKKPIQEKWFMDKESCYALIDELKELKTIQGEMNHTLNTFITTLCKIDDEMRFIRNLINFGGNKASEIEKKGKQK